MSDIATLDTEILKLQKELESFRDLQKKLDAVHQKAERLLDRVVAQTGQAVNGCRDAVQDMESAAKKTLESTGLAVGEKYDRLTTQNHKQFQKLSEAWAEQLAVAKESTVGMLQVSIQVKAGADRLGELSKKLRAISDADGAIPARLDKIDSTIAASLLVAQGLQARFDAMKSDLDRMADGMKKEVKDQAVTTRLEIQSAIGKSKDELAATIVDGIHEITDNIDQSAKGLSDNVAQVETKLSATRQELKSDIERVADGITKVTAENNTSLHQRLDKMMRRMIFIASILFVFLLASLGVGIAALLHKAG